MFNAEKSAILFSDKTKTTFILDIPQSIKQAQSLSPHQKETQQNPPLSISLSHSQEFKSTNKCLISTPSLTEPYPTTTEPKSESARAKVLARIPEGERTYHEGILPVVNDALETIQQEFGSQQGWCLPRCFVDESQVSAGFLKRGDDDCASVSLKRKRISSSRDLSKYQSGPNSDGFHHETSAFYENSGLGSTQFDHLPVILSSTSENGFETMSEVNGVVKNTSFEIAHLSISNHEMNLNGVSSSTRYIIPPRSNFILCTLPLSSHPHDNTFTSDSIPTHTRNHHEEQPIPGLSKDQKFNLILFDPPWPNKSVRRSKHYQTHPYAEMDSLTKQLSNILQIHAQPPTSDSNNSTQHPSIAAIWITNAEKTRRAAYNALNTSGFRVCEEWIWVKVTNKGIPITPINGLWRKPYEILVIGRKNGIMHEAERDFSSATCNMNVNVNVQRSSILGSYSESDFHSVREKITRRVIAAVPDIHSRKPNLRDLFEDIFFTGGDAATSSSSAGVGGSYMAMEVFARNLTAGWWGCGNEVLKFNEEKCWANSDLN